ncbi:unnamed protein product [Arabidopsis thaliana]|uniref:(thale cress) hypothetical protein n=1 Tax=Arabidopsis thaliana TaxID=3702 RepID=A0A7G2F0J5_ARATH|nr:unnamed protein product [Arabidopsis thaliana]
MRRRDDDRKFHGRIFFHAKIEEREGGGIDYLKVLEWDVDSFDGLEDYSSPEVLFSSDEEPFSEEAVQHYCLFKRQMIESKESNVELVEIVRGYYRAGPRSKSYITFMAREKPDGPLVEYQAKCMVTLDRKRHPILCRPAPTPKP